MRIHWKHLLLLSASLLVSTADFVDDDEDSSPDVIYEDKLKVDGPTFVVRNGVKFVASCVFQGDEIADMSDIQWKTENGKNIDGEASSSVFTIALLEHGTHHKKRNLHFSAIDKRDEGVYICEARDLDGKTHTKKITIKVLPVIEWSDPNTSAGALVGEPLTIDCSARGSPEPTIQITDENGEPLDEELFTIAGNEVTVQSLSKDYDGKVISCVALQVLSDYDTTSTEQKDVKIDAWHKPEFAAEKIDRYAIVGRSATLPCNITSSKPKPAHFTYYKGTEELSDPIRYQLLVDVRHPSASLKILSVTHEDLGEYRCEVNNRKASGSVIINLKEASPPDEVKATLERTKKNAIVWRIDTNEDVGELPVERILIDFIRKNLVQKDESDEYDENNENQIWHTQATRVVRQKTDDGLYEINGLRPDTEYIFRFVAESEAGQGDIFEITVTTADENPSKDLSASASGAVFTLLTLFLSLSL